MTALATLLADPTQEIAFVARLEERDPGTDTVTERHYATSNWRGGEGYARYLSDPGGRSDRMEVDELEAVAAQTVAPIRFRNEPTGPGGDGPLDFLRDRSLAGRPIAILAGAPDEPIANYEPVASGTMDREPVFDGNTVEIRIQSALERLNVDLDVGTYVGEPGAVQTLTSLAEATTGAHSATFDLTSFTITARFNVASFGAGAVVFPIIFKVFSTASSNWNLRVLGPAFDLSHPNCLQARYTSGGVEAASFFSEQLETDRWYSAVFARRSGHCYLMLDGEIVGEQSVGGDPDLAAVPVRIALNAGVTAAVCDLRVFDHYIAPDEMRAAAAVRASGNEEGLVGLWRCDDQTGSTITDYSSTGAHATLTGTEGVDFEHVSSDLGTEELAGRSMAVIMGEVFNAPADLVDPVRERWRVSDVASAGFPDIGQVRDQGELLNPLVPDYSWPSGAPTFELASEAGEPVTVRVRAAPGVQHAGAALFVANLEARGALANGDYDVRRYSAINPVEFGLWTRRRRVSEILSEALGGTLGHVATRPDGTFRVDALVPPTAPGPRGESCLEIASSSLNTSGVAWAIGGAGILTSRDFTVCAWVKSHRWGPDEFGFGDIPVLYLAGAGDKVAVTIEVSDGVPSLRLLRIEASATEAAVAGIGQIFDIEDGSQWWFVATVHDHTTSSTRLYAAPAGSVVALKGTDADINFASTPSITGVEVGGLTRFSIFRGGVAEPQVWNDLLTLAELQALMDAPPAGTEPALAFYAPLNGSSAAALTDAVSATAGAITGDVRQVPNLEIDLDLTPHIFRPRRLRPAHRIETRYRRNYAPLAPEAIAASVAQEDALDLQLEYRSLLWEEPAIADDYLSSRELVLETPWVSAKGALVTSRLARHRFSPGREAADLLGADRRALPLEVNDEVRVYGSRWGLSAGIVYRVIANQVRLAALTCDLGLWR